jgi:hypothetical protein
MFVYQQKLTFIHVNIRHKTLAENGSNKSTIWQAKRGVGLGGGGDKVTALGEQLGVTRGCYLYPVPARMPRLLSISISQ